MAVTPEIISERIERARKVAKLPVRKIAEQVWPQQGSNARYSWYKKINLRGSEFSLDDTNRIAALLGAPEGWPFVEWERCPVCGDDLMGLALYIGQPCDGDLCLCGSCATPLRRMHGRFRRATREELETSATMGELSIDPGVANFFRACFRRSAA